MYSMQLTKCVFGCITHSFTEYKACSYRLLTTFTQLDHIFQEIRAHDIHIPFTHEQRITYKQLHLMLPLNQAHNIQAPNALTHGQT